MADGRVQHADGTAEKKAAVCNYPRYTSTGLPVSAGAAATPPDVNGWLENANIFTGSPTTSYGAMIAIWTVPPRPRANDGQWLFFFPGLEDINDTQSILQPVLQWSPSEWVIASWNCCLNNVVTESPVVAVNPGDKIYGSITSACPAGTLSCPTWNVLTLDMSTGESTTLSNTPSAGQIFNWAFGAVLEPYYVVACDDYPPDRRVVFDRVTLFDQYLHPIAEPNWSEVSNSTAQPQCGYGVKAKHHEVSLDY